MPIPMDGAALLSPLAEVYTKGARDMRLLILLCVLPFLLGSACATKGPTPQEQIDLVNANALANKIVVKCSTGCEGLHLEIPMHNQQAVFQQATNGWDFGKSFVGGLISIVPWWFNNDQVTTGYDTIAKVVSYFPRTNNVMIPPANIDNSVVNTTTTNTHDGDTDSGNTTTTHDGSEDTTEYITTTTTENNNSNNTYDYTNPTANCIINAITGALECNP